MKVFLEASAKGDWIILCIYGCAKHANTLQALSTVVEGRKKDGGDVDGESKEQDREEVRSSSTKMPNFISSEAPK